MVKKTLGTTWNIMVSNYSTRTRVPFADPSAGSHVLAFFFTDNPSLFCFLSGGMRVLSLRLSFYPFMNLIFLSAYLIIYLCVCLSVYLFYLHTSCLPTSYSSSFPLLIYLPVPTHYHLSVDLFVDLSICLSIYLFPG